MTHRDCEVINDYYFKSLSFKAICHVTMDNEQDYSPEDVQGLFDH
jgi:hypothetical protein